MSDKYSIDDDPLMQPLSEEKREIIFGGLKMNEANDVAKEL